MKVDKEVVETLIAGLEYSLWELGRDVYFGVHKIVEANTVEEIMEYKKEILLKWLSTMPLYSDTCYFCKLHSVCEECEYAKYHGECCSGEMYSEYKHSLREVVEKFVDLSDWRLIKGLVEVLTSVIKEKYYYGEEYETDQPDAP